VLTKTLLAAFAVEGFAISFGSFGLGVEGLGFRSAFDVVTTVFVGALVEDIGVVDGEVFKNG